MSEDAETEDELVNEFGVIEVGGSLRNWSAVLGLDLMDP